MSIGNAYATRLASSWLDRHQVRSNRPNLSEHQKLVTALQRCYMIPSVVVSTWSKEVYLEATTLEIWQGHVAASSIQDIFLSCTFVKANRYNRQNPLISSTSSKSLKSSRTMLLVMPQVSCMALLYGGGCTDIKSTLSVRGLAPPAWLRWSPPG